jgi:hypothetical protein
MSFVGMQRINIIDKKISKMITRIIAAKIVKIARIVPIKKKTTIIKGTKKHKKIIL